MDPSESNLKHETPNAPVLSSQSLEAIFERFSFSKRHFLATKSPKLKEINKKIPFHYEKFSIHYQKPPRAGYNIEIDKLFRVFAGYDGRTFIGRLDQNCSLLVRSLTSPLAVLQYYLGRPGTTIYHLENNDFIILKHMPTVLEETARVTHLITKDENTVTKKREFDESLKQKIFSATLAPVKHITIQFEDDFFTIWLREMITTCLNHRRYPPKPIGTDISLEFRSCVNRFLQNFLLVMKRPDIIIKKALIPKLERKEPGDVREYIRMATKIQCLVIHLKHADLVVCLPDYIANDRHFYTTKRNYMPNNQISANHRVMLRNRPGNLPDDGVNFTSIRILIIEKGKVEICERPEDWLTVFECDGAVSYVDMSGI